MPCVNVKKIIGFKTFNYTPDDKRHKNLMVLAND